MAWSRALWKCMFGCMDHPEPTSEPAPLQFPELRASPSAFSKAMGFKQTQNVFVKACFSFAGVADLFPESQKLSSRSPDQAQTHFPGPTPEDVATHKLLEFRPGAPTKPTGIVQALPNAFGPVSAKLFNAIPTPEHAVICPD